MRSSQKSRSGINGQPIPKVTRFNQSRSALTASVHDIPGSFDFNGSDIVVESALQLYMPGSWSPEIISELISVLSRRQRYEDRRSDNTSLVISDQIQSLFAALDLGFAHVILDMFGSGISTAFQKADSCQ